jgi:hypothetical protein
MRFQLAPVWSTSLPAPRSTSDKYGRISNEQSPSVWESALQCQIDTAPSVRTDELGSPAAPPKQAWRRLVEPVLDGCAQHRRVPKTISALLAAVVDECRLAAATATGTDALRHLPGRRVNVVQLRGDPTALEPCDRSGVDNWSSKDPRRKRGGLVSRQRKS